MRLHSMRYAGVILLLLRLVINSKGKWGGSPCDVLLFSIVISIAISLV